MDIPSQDLAVPICHRRSKVSGDSGASVRIRKSVMHYERQKLLRGLIMNRQSGVTLVELMVTLIVLLIVFSIGVPSFNRLLSNNRSTTLINHLVSDLNLVRSEAIKRQSIVTICNRSGTDCAGGGGDANKWQNGWIVWVDADDDATFDSGEEILIRDTLSDGWSLGSDGFATASSLSYNGSGRHGHATVVSGTVSFAPTTAGSFILCQQVNGAQVFRRALVVAPMGYVRQPRDSDDNGILEDHSDSALTNASCT